MTREEALIELKKYRLLIGKKFLKNGRNKDEAEQLKSVHLVPCVREMDTMKTILEDGDINIIKSTCYSVALLFEPGTHSNSFVWFDTFLAGYKQII